MPEDKSNQKGKDFATSGTESFKIGGVDNDKEKVVINIQEEKPGEAVVLDEAIGKGPKNLYQKANTYFISKSKIKTVVKANFFHLLSVMINAGIPMVKSLRSLAIQEKNPRMQMIVHSIADQIEGGKRLSDSLAAQQEVFNDQEIGMAESGEASGQLSKVLENIAKDLEKAASIKGKIKSAMMYPIIVFLLLISVMAAMMIFVVPKLTELFSSNQIELPLITRIVVAISDFMVNQKIVMLVAILLIAVIFHLFKKTAIGRFALDNFKLKVPIFGKLFMKAYLSRFARSLSNLLDSNITIVKTIEITANSIGNEVYRRRLLLAMEDIKQGIPLAENLTDSDLFPPMLVNMVDVGEKTAQLDEISAKVADFYEDEVDTAVAGISKIIEPVILIVIGLSVGTIVASIMLPIMKLTDVAGTI